MQEIVDNRSPHPYVPNTPTDQQIMLKAIGVNSVADLFAPIPADKRNPHLDLPAPMSEQELLEYSQELADKNVVGVPNFLGAGDYRHFIPAVVGQIQTLSGFYSAYTPYQPEISQGTLTAAFEGQTMACGLMGTDVANTGMYDGATALAEAALMAARVTGRKRIVALDTIHPNDLDTVRTYAFGKDLELDVVPEGSVNLDSDTACVLLQSPDYFGRIASQRKWINMAHDVGALGVVSVNNIASLGLLANPGRFGADIAVGEGSSLGNPSIFGGVNLGLFTTLEKHMRQMPGRIVGKTEDGQGRTGYVLTLQTREQHIRRERATSNICTAEQLVMLGLVAHLSLLGPDGFRALAERSYHRAHYAADQISQLPGFGLSFKEPFFNEFVVSCPVDPSEINERLLDERFMGKDRIIGGKDVSNRVDRGMLICATELNSRKQIDRLVGALRKVTK